MDKLYIGNVEIANRIILAPMAGITNLAYRSFMKPFGCGLVVSEMVSDYALIYGNKETRKMLETKQEEHPLAVQLFGGSKESLVKGAKILLDIGNFEILDINLGCPVPKVVKENAGSSWLKKERQEELYEAIHEIVSISSKPVTCKIRLGWDENTINVVETCKILEKAGVALIAIHGRTRAAMYLGHANYQYIKEAKENVQIPIIANGDINSLEDAIKVLEITKADGIMLGRGALGNPKLVTQIDHYLKTGEKLPDATFSEQISYLIGHFESLLALKGEFKCVSEMRGIASHYLKGFPNVKYFKARLSQMKSKEEFYQIIQDIKNDCQL
jgi:nifR3 family TIM-barrel protein